MKPICLKERPEHIKSHRIRAGLAKELIEEVFVYMQPFFRIVAKEEERDDEDQIYVTSEDQASPQEVVM